MVKIVGIDYGAQTSGNTVIAHKEEHRVHLIQIPQKKHTDTWLQAQLVDLKSDVVYLDAPLSLPLAFSGLGDNFHYRKCDQLTKAMSPLFLGGLTARAMQLKHDLSSLIFHEVYPAFFQSERIGSLHYKNNMDLFLDDLHKTHPFQLQHSPDNWHQVDALIALLIGQRHQQKKHREVGNPQEGIIII